MLTLRSGAFPKWLRLPTQAVVACLVGLLLGGASLWVSPLWVLAGLAALCFLVAILRRPESGLLAILVMTSTVVFENRLPLIPVGIGSLNLPDVPLLVLAGLVLVRWAADAGFRFVHTPTDVPLLVFLGMVVLSTFVAVARSSVSVTQALRGMRPIAYYLTFFVVTNLVRREGQLYWLIEALLGLATLTAAVMVAQFVLGRSIILLPGRVETLVTQGATYTGITRLLPPGQSLVMFGFVILVALLATDNSLSFAALRSVQAALLGFAIVLTFNRNFWVMAALTLGILAGVISGQDRLRLLRRGMLVLLVTAIVLLSAAVSSGRRVAGLVQATRGRLVTLISSDTLRESSLQFRYIENTYALPQIATHPIIGLGLCVPYRPWDRRLDPPKVELVHAEWDRTSYVHNGHFWALLTSGWFGYLALIWLTVSFTVRGFRCWRAIPNVRLRAILLACALTSTAVPIAAIVNPIYSQWFWIPVIGIMLGTGEQLLRQTLVMSTR